MKQLCCILMLMVLFLSCKSQPKKSGILQKKVENIDTADMGELIRAGYIKKTDAPLIGSYIITLARKHPDLHNITVGQLLDSVKALKLEMDHQAAIQNNWGKDSVFIKIPNGERYFMGMGSLSFEKLVDRVSANLPDKYEGDYNLKINTTDAIKKLAQMVASVSQSWIAGNVLLLNRDQGKLKDLRIGDIFEITDRVAAAKEFAPFVNEMK